MPQRLDEGLAVDRVAEGLPHLLVLQPATGQVEEHRPTVDGEMIDLAVVAGARRTLARASAAKAP
ncbi:hypothetical protein ACFY4C_32895 [Actinomadura viridis]|uniref:hypothetical protein n=1 Tax=Actinomadura viridis TaxID=58110 RepID=UPI003688861F